MFFEEKFINQRIEVFSAIVRALETKSVPQIKNSVCAKKVSDRIRRLVEHPCLVRSSLGTKRNELLSLYNRLQCIA